MRDSMERVTDYIKPVRIVKEEGTDNAAFLLKSERDQIHIYEPEVCTVAPKGYIVLDYGKELHGGIRLLTRSGAEVGETEIRIRFGESVGECFAEVGPRDLKIATNDHSPRDIKACVPSLSDLTMGQTGFRFIRIDNLSDKPYGFVSALAAFLHIKEEPVGSFRCDDEKVNEIFDTAAYTLFLNMQSGLWDGIKRDRLVWIGDMHPEVKGILNLFGANTLVEKGLKESAEHNPVPMWITGMPSYSVWWLIILCDYYYRTGRKEFTFSQLPYLYDVLGLLKKFITEDGCVDMTREGGGSEFCRYFLNWETSEEEGRESGLRGLILCAARKCSDMLKSLGKDYSLAEEIAAKLSRNAVFEGESKAVASLYALGYTPDEKAKEILTGGGAEGFSTFISSYILNALADMGKGEEAIFAMKEFYGGMLDRGATTFWESYEPEWLIGSGRIDELTPEGLKDIHSAFGKYCYGGYRLSLCHGWACGPVPFLMERVLGVKFTSVGGKTIKIEPDLMGLKKAKGKIPTPYGIIEISHEVTGGKIHTEYTLPEGITLEKQA